MSDEIPVINECSPDRSTRVWLQGALENLEANYKPSREKALVKTKIDEALLWLGQIDGVGP